MSIYQLRDGFVRYMKREQLTMGREASQNHQKPFCRDYKSLFCVIHRQMMLSDIHMCYRLITIDYIKSSNFNSYLMT
jgi:hypothetical protein